jgi:hypothetical protein
LPEQTAVDEWRLIISDLESDVARLKTGELIAGERIASADWSPPTIVGPLPDEYAQHVRALIQAQLEAITALEEAKRATGERIAALRAVDRTRQSTGAVYLDVEG